MVGKPWESLPDLWKDERAYLNWLRGQIRRIWARHPIKHRYVATLPVVTPDVARKKGLPIGVKLTARTKKLRCCALCEHWFPPSHTEVDHIHGGIGFHDYQSFLGWQQRMLFVDFSSLRLLCKGCHAKVTLSQKLGCTLEEVPMHEERIAFTKMKAGEQNKLLESLELSTGSNPEARLQIFMEHLGDKYDKTS